MNRTHEHNRRAWDERVRQCKPHMETARAEDFQNPLAVVDDCGWLGGNVVGKRLLCLAAGGGRHGPLFAAAGAVVTVVDLSQQMLELDQLMADKHGLKLNLVAASMENLSMLPGAGFEIVIQPVSTCYVPEVGTVYREIARVTVAGGIYISQHKQPASLQAETLPAGNGYLVSEPYARSGPLPPVAADSRHREAGTLEFIHRWDELIGGLCRSGFVVEDLVEPRHGDPRAAPGSFAHRSCYLPPYVTLKARRRHEEQRTATETRLWTPSRGRT